MQRQGDERGGRGGSHRSPAELGEDRNRQASEEESTTEEAGEAATGDEARQSEPEALSARAPTGARGTALPHINSATRNELLTNTAIDEPLADRILAGRPFRTIEDMDDVLDIGRERIARIGQSMTLPREMGEGRDR